jgi:hypothetical protein
VVVIAGLALGGAGAAAFVVLSGPDPQPSPQAEAPAESGTPQALAQAVVSRLNAKDLDGVIELTCAQGKSTGRRELTKAIPQLDPATPAETRNAPIEFELGDVREFPDGYVASLIVRYEGTAQDGTMRIQRNGEKWTLCGMNSPRIGGVG